MDKVAFLPASVTMTPEQALDSAKHLDLKDVLVIGYNTDGELVVRSSRMIRRDALWMIEAAKIHVMQELYS